MNTYTITSMETRKRFGEIINRVSIRGDHFTIERAGRPLAQIVPITHRTKSKEDDIFDRPFASFTEWDDVSNDPYDVI